MIISKVTKHKQFVLTILIGIALLIGCAETTAPPATEKPILPHATLAAEGMEPALPAAEDAQPIESAPSDAATPITTHLVLSKAPALNETVYLTFTISSVMVAPQTTAAITLPEGAVLVDGDLEWTGDLKPNEPQTMQAAIAFKQEGEWTIEAKALHEVGNGDVWGDMASIYLTVSDDAHFDFSTESHSDAPGTEDLEPPSVEPSP